MRGDLGTLYDAHADRLLAHCWSLLGDEGAADAVRDAFVAAVRHPPRGDIVLWLYALSRSACAERGAFTGTPRPVFGTGRPVAADPLLRAVGELRPDHREALLLHAGEWLEVPDIARVLGIAPDTVRGLLHAARTRLERAVVDQLMHGAPGDHRDVITAFEKGRLPHLLARRAPVRPPSWLRDRVLEACEAGATRPLTEITSPSPLVVIGSEVAAPPGRDRTGRRTRIKGVGAMAGMAASVAAAAGLLVSWPSAKSDGVNAIVPSAGNSPTGSPDPSGLVTDSGGATPERGNGTGTGTPPEPSPATQDQRPTSTAPRGTGSNNGAGGGTGSEPAAPPSKPETSRPDKTTTPPQDSPAPEDPSPADPGTPEEPSTPPDSPAPSDPPDPSQPPSDPPGESPEPGPSPTSNPAPSPTTSG
ncbi:sigma factor-like helix-turn-helix DNA-binding protein [Spirillospora sp. CA-255316]